MLGLILGGVLISFSPILVKEAGLGPSYMAFYRVLFGALTLFIITLFQQPKNPQRALFKKTSKIWTPMLLASLFFVGDLSVWHRSVIYAGAGMSTVLANTQIFYLSIFGILFLKEKLTIKFIFAVPLAFLGILLLVDFPGPALLPSEHYQAGIFYGLLTGLFYSGYIVFLRKAELAGRSLNSTEKLGIVSALCILPLFILALLNGEVVVPSSRELTLLAVLGILPHAIGWLLITINLPKLPLSRASLVLLLQPTLSMVWGVLFLGETLSTSQTLGAGLTLFAIYLATTRFVRKEKILI